jgi:hypothetical protein
MEELNAGSLPFELEVLTSSFRRLELKSQQMELMHDSSPVSTGLQHSSMDSTETTVLPLTEQRMLLSGMPILPKSMMQQSVKQQNMLNSFFKVNIIDKYTQMNI